MGIRTTMESALLRQGGSGRAGGEPSGSERPGRRLSGHWFAVGALTALVAAGYTVFVLAQYYTFQSSADDLVIFDQAVNSYAHFKPGTSIFIGFHLSFGPNFSLLGNHWSPILIALAPLFWIYNSPATLLVAQAVLFALAIPPLWVFTRRALGGGGKATLAAYLVSGAYALSWPIASALTFNFHEVAFAPLLTVVALERLQAGRLRGALIALGILLLVKEDMGLFVAGIGLYLAVSRTLVSRQRLLALALIVGGFAYTWFATDVLIPAAGGRANFYWAYTALGPNVPQAAWHLLTHPGSLRLMVTPDVKLQTMLWLFGAFCFLSLWSPISLATIPLLLERMLANTSSNWWVTPFQYNAYLVIVLACAAVDGAGRLDLWAAWFQRRWAAWFQRRRAERAATTEGALAAERVPAADGAPAAEAPAEETPGDTPVARPARDRTARGAVIGTGWVALACAVAMFLVAVALIPRFAFAPGLHRSFYHRTASERAEAAADAVIPSGVTVAAVNSLGPVLAARDTVVLFDGDGGTPPLYAPWVAANVGYTQFTFKSWHEQKQRVAYLERNGYRVVFLRDGWIVLHRVGAGAASGKPAP
jgi:uncharacterized membrane protein